MSARFGEVERIVRTEWASATRPVIIQISNMRNDAGERIGGLGSGELDWHTDQSYMAEPATGVFLYAVELPRAGGDTYWANLQIAYEALPERTKRRIEGRRAVFSYAERVKGYDSGSRATTRIARPRRRSASTRRTSPTRSSTPIR